MNIRTLVILSMTLLILGTVNTLAYQQESLARNGVVVLIPLRPADPRSLMQGDYMTLAYNSRELNMVVSGGDGMLAVERDERGVAERFRVYQPGSALGAGELLLRYHTRNHQIRIGNQTFFFEEGTSGIYAGARYAELRVSPDGESMVVGLRDEALMPLGQAAR